MASPQQKLVKVDDNIIAFPGDLEDAHVAKLIKSFRDKKKQPKRSLMPKLDLYTITGKSTEKIDLPPEIFQSTTGLFR